MIKQQGLGVHWISDSTHYRRLYEINITQVMVPLGEIHSDIISINSMNCSECTCTLYRDKKITSARQFEFTFPPNCTFIYCYYQFTPPVSPLFIIFQLSIESRVITIERGLLSSVLRMQWKVTLWLLMTINTLRSLFCFPLIHKDSLQIRWRYVTQNPSFRGH